MTRPLGPQLPFSDELHAGKYRGEGERPGLFVVAERCPDFVRTFVPIPRDEADPDDVDSDVEDHIADEVRYRVRFKRKEVRQGSF